MKLKGKVAWVTGGGSGIGEAAALALAAEGAEIVLTGRTPGKLESVAQRIEAIGARAHVRPADLMDSGAVQGVADYIKSACERVDILVNNAGVNVRARSWEQLRPEGADEVIRANLSAVFYCVIAVLPMMRAQRDGVIVHTSSWAGRYLSPVVGAAYTATKHAVIALSETLNMEECAHGIRSTVLCPGEVATPILDSRPNPPSQELRAQMVQAADCGNLIRYIACLPPHLCMNEVLLSPTANRGYLAQRSAMSA